MTAAPAPLVVLWRITERCNLGCGFCAYDRALNRTRHEASASTAETFGELLGAYQRLSGRRVLVSWLGGEPLLWSPLIEMSERFRLQHGLQLSLTTNGTRLDRPETRDLLTRLYAEVTVSVDGLGHFHDAVRGRAGLFNHLAGNVSQLAADKRAHGTGPLLRANVVLMRDNVADLPRLCHEVARWGIEEITFNQLGGNDRPEFFASNRLLPPQTDALAELLPSLQAELADRGVALRGNSAYLRRISASSRDIRLSPADCDAGRAFLFIDEKGRIAPCSFTPGDYGIALSDITDAAMLETLPARFTAQRSTRRAPGCEDCHSTQHFGKFAGAAV